MESALAQVGMAGAADRDHGLIAGDDRLHERASIGASVVAERQRRRPYHAARMHGALPEAVVEFDAVGGGAAEEGGVDDIGPARAAGHWNAAGRTRRREHGFGAGRDVAARARDHHADGVEQMAPRVVAHLIGKGGVTEFTDEFDDGGSRAGGGMERRQRFGVDHGFPSLGRGGRAGRLEAYAFRASFTRASTATTPSPGGRTISGLISASAMLASSASRESATIACASAFRSPAGLPL